MKKNFLENLVLMNVYKIYKSVNAGLLKIMSKMGISVLVLIEVDVILKLLD
jgi:hypothetical protein